jgi:hypothetical protein
LELVPGNIGDSAPGLGMVLGGDASFQPSFVFLVP